MTTLRSFKFNLGTWVANEVNMWYDTEMEAEEACKWKEIEYKTEFVVLKDSVQPNCYWAQRKNAG